MSGPGADATRLTRRLGMLDAVVVGLGAMIGAGGTYVYGRERLGEFLGLPGGMGVRGRQDGKLRGDGAHLRGVHLARVRRSHGFGAVVVLTAVDYRGVRKTAWLAVLAAGGAVWLVRTTLMGAARP